MAASRYHLLYVANSLVRRLQAAHSDLALPLDANLEADARRVSSVAREIAARRRSLGQSPVPEEERLAVVNDLNLILARLEKVREAAAGADVLEVTTLDDLLVRLQRAIHEI